MANHFIWVDIPVKDLDRAIAFYSKVLGVKINRQEQPLMGVFEHGEHEVSGLLHPQANYEPAQDGPLLYLNVDGRLDDAISQVESSGGRVIKSRHQIGPYGYRALIVDCEGNRMALHSNS